MRRYLPRLRHGAFSVWRRNALVWRRLIGPSLVLNFGEPLLYLLGLGFGLGLFIGEMMDMPYLTFLASGILASSAMNTASFEAMFSVYTRMVPQRTYDAILATPLEVQDIVAGEMLWSASKALVSGTAILIVAALLGAVRSLDALWVIPLLFLFGLAFAGPALIVTGLSRGYDYFNYYLTLLVTPMFILSGVFYPVTSLPDALQAVVYALPLVHAVELVRPLVANLPVSDVPLHVGVLAAYAIVGYLLAVRLIRRRLVV